MFVSFQYGLRPRRAQHRALDAILEGQRLLYALQERTQAWRKARTSITLFDQSRSLTVNSRRRSAWLRRIAGDIVAMAQRWTHRAVEGKPLNFVVQRRGKAGCKSAENGPWSG
jgi:hypothetical protein